MKETKLSYFKVYINLFSSIRGPVVILVTWVMHCCVRVITFNYKLYKLEAVVQNDAPPLPPKGQKVGGERPPSRPPPAPEPMVFRC